MGSLIGLLVLAVRRGGPNTLPYGTPPYRPDLPAVGSRIVEGISGCISEIRRIFSTKHRFVVRLSRFVTQGRVGPTSLSRRI